MKLAYPLYQRHTESAWNKIMGQSYIKCDIDKLNLGQYEKDNILFTKLLLFHKYEIDSTLENY